MRDRAFPEGNVISPAASLTWLCQARVIKGRWQGAIICDGILLHICTPFSCSSFQQTSTFPVQGTHPFSQMNYPEHLRHFSISCQAHQTNLPSAGNEPDVLWQPQAGQQRESSHLSRSEAEQTSISLHQQEQDVSPQVTVVISSHSDVWMQRVTCQVLLTQDSFEKSDSFVVWYHKEQERIPDCLIFFHKVPTGNIWGEKVVSIPQVRHCKVSVCFTQHEGTLWNYRHWKWKTSKCEKSKRHFMSRKSSGTNLPSSSSWEEISWFRKIRRFKFPSEDFYLNQQSWSHCRVL